MIKLESRFRATKIQGNSVFEFRRRDPPPQAITYPLEKKPLSYKIRNKKRRNNTIMLIRRYEEKDLEDLIEIWNEVVEEGVAFPQEEKLEMKSGHDFFAQQSYTGVAEKNGKVLGLYILHPNNIGRCGHICNASYAVSSKMRGQHIGEKLVSDCLKKGKELGFGVLQFNAVVESNTHARHLYERLGFKQLGTIPKGFRMKDGNYENICPYYHEL